MMLMIRHLGLAALAFAPLLHASELYRSSRMPANADKIEIAPFGYNGLTGPLNWYGLDPKENKLCDLGASQSPIDITADRVRSGIITREKGSAIDMDVPNVDSALFENIGSFVEVVTNGSLLLRDKGRRKKYKLVEFHYHVPSEHRIDGEVMAMEEHWLFEAADQSMAVVTFFAELSESGVTGPRVHHVLSDIEKIAKPGTATKTGPLNFQPILKHLHSNDVWRYVGSLTSPPCTENIKWIISTKPLRISAATYNKAKKVLKFNARFTQDVPGSINLIEKASRELKDV